MTKIKRLLQSKSGETLVETLVSILIFTMASIAMFSMCQSANNLNAKVKNFHEDIQKQVELLESAEVKSPDFSDNTNIQFNFYKQPLGPSGTYRAPVPVDVYGNSGKLITYFHHH